ncbi:MAG: helix-turn-helix domain-containing protein [Actinomycetota bacterium]
MSGPVKGRPYRSPLRAEQASNTRARILTAARELFTDVGYPRTTIGQVGLAAGVAADTVLHVFGSKKGLLRAVLDVETGGDDADVRVLDRDEPQAMRRETDQRRQIAMFSAGMTEQLERIRPIDDILRSAAAVDVDARELRDDIQLRQRREAMTTIASWIADNGGLRDGVDVPDAADIIWTLTSPEVHQLLRDHCAWDVEKYRRWLRDALERSLLKDS